jgi:hypothetical protein
MARRAKTMNTPPGWYFTAPWEPVAVRRGDALGFRAAADYFADRLAPDLSNASSDARWISLLSWCLKWSHVAWRKAGGGIDVSGRDAQSARYAWLRPLELLWVARALESGQTTGQLRGKRSVLRWLRAEQAAENFAMSAEQFRRYRQVGMYGAYRVVFRRLPGLTTGDGWTPARTALDLAAIVNDSLPASVRLADRGFGNRTKWGAWRGGGEARFWVERGWPNACATRGGVFPTPNDALTRPLPPDERRLIEAVLFPDSSLRRTAANALAAARLATSHAEVCDVLATSQALAKAHGPAALAPLPSFTRFADAAMHAMRGLWKEVNADPEKQAPSIESVARSAELGRRLEVARDAGQAWLNTAARIGFPYEAAITRLATSLNGARDITAMVRALVLHHAEHGGGRRWFREQGGTLVPLVPYTAIAASSYRFRLQTLCRLAGQCGVADTTALLGAVSRSDFDEANHEVSEDADEDLDGEQAA